MNFSRLVYIVCLSLSSFSMSVYADDMWQQPSSKTEMHPGQHGTNGSGQAEQPAQVNDDGGNLKAIQPNDKNKHYSTPPQSSSNDTQQQNNSQNAENTPPAMNVTQTEANNFDTV